MNENIRQINKFSSKINTDVEILEMETLITQQLTTLTSLTGKILREYNDYINAINLGQHGIISPIILTPKSLLQELQNFKGEDRLPMDPIYSEIHSYYKVIYIDAAFSNNLLIFAFKIPLVTKETFNLYKLIPLPVLNPDGNTVSYIEPRSPYLLLSHSKTSFSFLQDLSECVEYGKDQYVCREVNTKQRSDPAVCEVQLMTPHVRNIPKDCRTRTLRATIETWYHVRGNDWIYVLPKPTAVTVICEGNHIDDLTLNRTGIFSLLPGCKAYSDTYILESTKEENRNISHFIPKVDILEDQCCQSNVNVEKKDGVQLQPIHLTNVDLNELQYADNKLREFDKVLSETEPFIVTHTKWYTLVLSLVGAIVLLVLLWNFCRCCGCCSLLTRLCCCVRRNRPPIRDIVPIQDEVDPALELMVYNGRREAVRNATPERMLAIQEQPQRQRIAYNLRPSRRRSTTPM